MDKQGKTLIAVLVIIVLAIVGYQMVANNGAQTPGEQMDAAATAPATTEQAATAAPSAQPTLAEQTEQATEEAGAELQQAGEQVSEEAQKMGNKAEDAVTTSPAEEAAKSETGSSETAE